MKLTKAQKDLAKSLYEPGYPDCWWECYPTEGTTTDALERRGLLEYSKDNTMSHISFDVRLTEKGREVVEALTKRT